MHTDPFNLDRFVTSQRDAYPVALAEIRSGQKLNHWMWFIFPQIAGLGHSEMSKFYSLGSRAEARAYLAHPLLGPRLHGCLEVLQDLSNTNIEAIFGDIDALKLRSSLTLFIAAGGGALFEAALTRWFDGQQDEATLELLAVAG